MNEEDIPWHVTALTAAVLCFICGAVATGIGAFGVLTCRDARDWPTREGRIVSLTPDSQPGEAFPPEPGGEGLAYRYEVDGRQYTGRRAAFGGVNVGRPSETAPSAARYEPGARVTVHYNPDNPAESVLDTSTPDESWTSLSMGIGALIASVLILMLVFHKKRKEIAKIAERWM